MKNTTASVTRPGYFRPSDAARYLSISLRTLRDWQHRRVIPFCRMGKRCILFKLSDLDAAITRFRIESIGGNYIPPTVNYDESPVLDSYGAACITTSGKRALPTAGAGVFPVQPQGGPGCGRIPGESAPDKSNSTISVSSSRCKCNGDGTCWRTGDTVCPQSWRPKQ
jgi:excisionase family DNA binding protein